MQIKNIIFALFLIQSLVIKAQYIKSKEDSIHVENTLTQIRNSWQDVQKTLQLCSQAVEIAKNSNDTVLLARTYFSVGVANLELIKNHDQALRYLIKGLNICEQNKDSVLLERCYQTIGNTYSDIYGNSHNEEDFKDAEKNLLTALKINSRLINRSVSRWVFLGNNYINLSDLYLKKQDGYQALAYALQAEKMYKKLNSKSGSVLTTANISKALLYIAMRTKNKEDLIKCRTKFMDYYLESRMNLNDSKVKFDSLDANAKFWTSTNLFDYYLSQAIISRLLKEGKDRFSQLIEMAEFYAWQTKQVENVISVYKSRSEYYESIDPAYSVLIKNRLLQLQDSANMIEAKKKNETLKAIYEFNNKEIEYAGIAADNKIKSAEIIAEKNQSRTKTILLIISTVSIIVFCIFLYYFLKLNRMLSFKNKLVSEQKVEITHKNRQITDSIQFSRIIQDEILFSKIDLSKHFSSHFLLYLPKDIVSGDFYLVKEIGDIKIVAVIDCTGHGSSGAMMSLHANSILEKVFEKCHSTDSAIYLNEINTLFNQSQSSVADYSNKFGMDISILVLKNGSGIASFASTNHALLISNKENCHEFKPLKATLGLTREAYVSYEVPIDTNSSFYLFTDGFFDQKGGSDNKKFLYKNFKDLIFSIKEFSTDRQLQILEKTFSDWKGKNPQTDDVTVLGFKL